MSDTVNTDSTLVEQPIVTETNVEPTKIHVEGLGDFTPDEIKDFKQGYMRQSDYTKKTQELSTQRKELENAVPQTVDTIVTEQAPNEIAELKNQIKELDKRYYNNMLNDEVTKLKGKYADFDEIAVLQKAQETGVTDLEFVYNGIKNTSSDVDSIKAQIRQEIMKEFNIATEATTTIIGGADTSMGATPTLTDKEKHVANLMGLTEKEYLEAKSL